VPFDLFWNCLPEIKWFGYLLAFFNVEKIAYIRTCFQKNLSKTCNILYEILILNLVFKENLAFIWPAFFIFEDLSFLKLLMTKFDLFRTWQPCHIGWMALKRGPYATCNISSSYLVCELRWLLVGIMEHWPILLNIFLR